MIFPIMISPFARLRRAARLVLALTLATSGSLYSGEPPIHNLSEKTSEAFGKLRPLLDEKDYDGVMALLDGLIPQIEPTSYDMAQVLDIKAKLYATQDQYGKAIEPWARALKLSDTYNYFDEKWTLDTLYFLAQLEYQEGLSSKVPAEQKQHLARASANLKRWLQTTNKVTADASSLYATMLFNRAMADSENVDLNLIKEARREVERGLLLAIEPKESFYGLLLVILQQEGDFTRASEILELLVNLFPQKANYWPTLMAFYLNVAGEATSDAESFNNYVRAINTIERAQSFGHMKTPKDNYNLVSLYIAADQFSKANELLYAGLKSGEIESDPKTWAVLGYYYQQARQSEKAVEVLKEAAGLFPTAGQLELQIGELYREREKTAEALEHYKNAVRKGNLDKPTMAYQLLAFAAYELKKFDEALAAILEAEKFPEAKGDEHLIRLKMAIEEAIQEVAKRNAESDQKNASQ